MSVSKLYSEGIFNIFSIKGNISLNESNTELFLESIIVFDLKYNTI